MSSTSRLYVLFSLPKSGAQAFASALDFGFRPLPFGKHYTPAMTVPNGLHAEIPVRRELAADLPNGGWLHTHAPMTFATIDALEAMAAPYIVMIRHPLDQIAAIYCHIVKHLDIMKPVPGHPELVYNLPMAPVRRALFADPEQIDAAMAHLVRDGYLEACLRWVADWLYWRDPQRSRLIRYEDFIRSPSQTLWNMQALLANCIAFNGNRLAQALDSIQSYRTLSYEQHAQRDTAYPRGWTGSIGVHTAYLSPDLQSEALLIVRRFVDTYPHGHLVSEAYPELGAGGLALKSA